MYLIKNYPQQSKWPVTAIPFMAIAVFALYWQPYANSFLRYLKWSFQMKFTTDSC